MTEEKNIVHQVDFESEHLTFRSIWHAALVLREAGENDEANGFWSLMAATLLACTAYEGFVNHLIERVFPEAWKEEQSQSPRKYRGTLGKTLFLADRLGAPLVRDARPYRTVAEIHAWRNELVHPQTVRISGTTRADEYARNPRRAKPVVFSKLERPTFVPRCFVDVPALADFLLQAARQEHGAVVGDLGDVAFSGVLGSSGASLVK